MYDDDPQDDAERELQEALALSMIPNTLPEQPNVPDTTKLENAPKKEEAPAEQKVDIDENFMKDVIGDLGLDINDSQLNELVNEAKKNDEKNSINSIFWPI